MTDFEQYGSFDVYYEYFYIEKVWRKKKNNLEFKRPLFN